MAVLEIEQNENSGLVKEIDSASIDLLFKNVQESQYSFPIKSFIREIFSNGIDSIKEKEIAYKILKEGKPENDFYLNRNEAEVKDSNFDSSYYNFDFLDMNSDKVFITYQSRENDIKDRVIIEDQGVGLSSYRLRKYTSIAWSSKRNTRHAIGKFGVGAKVGLAISEFFTIRTFYNGYETTLMIYHDYFHCISVKDSTSKVEQWKGFNKKGTEMSIPIIWNKTEEVNGAIVTLEVNKHTKEKYIQAVKEQLIYFQDKVSFCIEYPDVKSPDWVDFETEILFESNNCVVPKISPHSEPHMIIEGINYGIIAWDELGMEKRWGRIAIKVSASDVKINQSRETVIWNDKTRTTVLNNVKAVTKDAENYLKDKVETSNNFFSWLKIVKNATVSSRDDIIVSELGKFVPKANLNFKWNLKDIYDKLKPNLHPNPKVAYLSGDQSSFDWLFKYYNVFSVTKISKRGKVNGDYNDSGSLSQTVVRDFILFNRTDVVVFANETSISLQFLEYIIETKQCDSIIYIREKSELHKENAGFGGEFNHVTRQLLREYAINLDTFEYPKDYLKEKEQLKKEETKKNKEETAKIKLLEKERKSSVILCKKFRPRYDELKLNEYNLRVDGFRFRNQIGLIHRYSYRKDKFKAFTYTTVIYGTSANIVEMSIIYQMLCNTRNVITDKFIFIIVSKITAKHLKEYNFTIFIEDFIMEKTENGFKLHDIFLKYNTARKVAELLQQYPYVRHLNNLSLIDNSLISILETLENYKKVPINAHTGVKFILESEPSVLNDLEILETFEALDTYLQNSETVNKLIYKGDTEEATKKSKEFFGSAEPLTINAIDVEFIVTLEALIQKLEPLVPILDNLNYEQIQIKSEDGVGEKIANLLKSLI